MLTKQEIEFVLECMDRVPMTGLKTANMALQIAHKLIVERDKEDDEAGVARFPGGSVCGSEEAVVEK